jgi:hypothetical protein
VTGTKRGRWTVHPLRFLVAAIVGYSRKPGHGRADGVELLNAQKDYLLAYCAAVLEVAGDSDSTDKWAKEELVGRMRPFPKGAPVQFMISLSTNALPAPSRWAQGMRRSTASPPRGYCTPG